jgi:hypothetical protein
MGCDIHAYIEVVRSDEGQEYVYEIARIRPRRNYVMFGALAGVRVDDVSHIEPKGIPLDTDCDDYWLRVNDDYADEEGYTSTENADKWVKRGYSFEHPANTPDYRRISCPDWHNASWLDADELEKAISEYDAFCKLHENPFRDGSEANVYRGILGMVKAIPGARFVFWFDN